MSDPLLVRPVFPKEKARVAVIEMFTLLIMLYILVEALLPKIDEHLQLRKREEIRRLNL